MARLMDKITKGKIKCPPFICIYGLQGIGKTTMAAKAPNAVFICTERGTDHIDTARFPDIEKWEDIVQAIDELLDDPGEFQSVIIDSIDWAEPLLHDYIARRYSKATIELAAGGYGKGYKEAAEEYRKLIGKLQELRTKHKMNVILVAHPTVKDVTNPQTQLSYHRYELKLRDDKKYLTYEAVDAVFFATFKTTFNKDTGAPTKTTDRVLYAIHDHNDGFDAKNRYGIKAPLSMDLTWERLVDQFTQLDCPPASESIFLMSKLLPLVKDDEMREKIQLSIMDNKDNAPLLHKMLLKVRTMTDDMQSVPG